MPFRWLFSVSPVRQPLVPSAPAQEETAFAQTALAAPLEQAEKSLDGLGKKGRGFGGRRNVGNAARLDRAQASAARAVCLAAFAEFLNFAERILTAKQVAFEKPSAVASPSREGEFVRLVPSPERRRHGSEESRRQIAIIVAIRLAQLAKIIARPNELIALAYRNP